MSGKVKKAEELLNKRLENEIKMMGEESWKLAGLLVEYAMFLRRFLKKRGEEG